jgi:molybdenum cofactor cytidylyltransferase
MKLAFIYLASGFARRFGSNKLLRLLAGRPLYQHGFNVLVAVGKELRNKGNQVELLVVSQYAEILAWSKSQGAVCIYNGQSSDGIATGMKLGIKAAQQADAYLFCVADQPFLQVKTLLNLVSDFAQGKGTLGCPGSVKRQGNPKLFAASYVPELLALQGDKGGQLVFQQHLAEAFYVKAENPELEDIDTLAEWERIK